MQRKCVRNASQRHAAALIAAFHHRMYFLFSLVVVRRSYFVVTISVAPLDRFDRRTTTFSTGWKRGFNAIKTDNIWYTSTLSPAHTHNIIHRHRRVCIRETKNWQVLLVFRSKNMNGNESNRISAIAKCDACFYRSFTNFLIMHMNQFSAGRSLSLCLFLYIRHCFRLNSTHTNGIGDVRRCNAIHKRSHFSFNCCREMDPLLASPPRYG